MNDLIGIQIVGLLFVLLMSYMTFLHFRRKEFTSKETFFWISSWVLLLIVIIFPYSLDLIIKNWLSFARRLDFFIVIGFMFILGISFYIYTLVRKNQNKIDRIVSKIAIEKKQ